MSIPIRPVWISGNRKALDMDPHGADPLVRTLLATVALVPG
ncbi:MAG TPA: hypothetical protein VIU11_05385 [Nakamurella sp.]